MQADFFEAVKKGDRMAVERMIEAQPDLKFARTESGISGVLLALYYGQVELAALLADVADERTALVVVSAPSYAHGIIDPIEPIAAAARAAPVSAGSTK